MGAPEQPRLPGMEDDHVPDASRGDEVVAPVADGTEPDGGTATPSGDVEADAATVADGDGPGDARPDEMEADEAAEVEAVEVEAVEVEADEVEADGVEPEPVARATSAEELEPAEPQGATDESEPAAVEPAPVEPGGTEAGPVEAAAEPDTDEIPLSAARDRAPEPASGAEPESDPEPEPESDPEPEPDSRAEPEAGPGAVAAPEPEPAPVPVPLHRPRERARTRLLEAMRPKLNRGQLLAALLCAGLGFGLVTQIQSTQSEQLDGLTQADLVRLLQEVNTEGDRLAEQEAVARDSREKLVADETGDRAAEALTARRLAALGVLAGTLPATGPGIRLTITDPKGEVDAATLLDTLQEVRDAGAEAVQINDVRVVASTAFEDLDGGVEIGGTAVRPPYTYLVIGDSETLDAAMRIPGGVLDVVEQKGGTGDVARLDRVDVTALHRVSDPQYARPAPEGSP